MRGMVRLVGGFLLVLAIPGATVGCSDTKSDELVRKQKQALGQPLGGETEPNPAAVSATPIRNDVVVRANTIPGSDVDFFSFTGQAGDRVYAATMTAFSPASTDTTLQLIGIDGATIIETDTDDGSL